MKPFNLLQTMHSMQAMQTGSGTWRTLGGWLLAGALLLTALGCGGGGGGSGPTATTQTAPTPPAPTPPAPPPAPGAVAPVLAANTTPLGFGAVTAGTTADLTFTVENTGGGTLVGAATTGAPFSIVAGGAYSLTAGQSQTITVRFAPAAAGPASGDVTCTGAAGATVSLSGNGQLGASDEFVVNRDEDTDQRQPSVASLATPAADGSVAVVIFSDGFDLGIPGGEPGHEHFCSAGLDANGVSITPPQASGRVGVAHHTEDVKYIGLAGDPTSGEYFLGGAYHPSNVTAEPHPWTLLLETVKDDGFDLGGFIALDTDQLVGQALTEIDIAVDPASANKFLTFRVLGSSTDTAAPVAGLDGRILGPAGSPNWTTGPTAAPAVTGVFNISSAPNAQQQSGRVAFDGSSYLVVWEESGVIRGRRFDATGNAFGNDFALSVGSGAVLPRLAPSPTSGGGFLVVWQQSTILGRIVHGDGALGAQATLNGAAVAPLGAVPAVASNPAGEWMVVWVGSDASGTRIVARKFDAALAAVSTETGVNQLTDPRGLLEPSLTWVVAAGKWLFVWAGFDADGRGVKGRYMP